jgi:hypothetical protein
LIVDGDRLDPFSSARRTERDPMPITAPDSGAVLPGVSADPTPLPGYPWTLRLAGAGRDRAAVEIYENGELIDVVTGTPVARLYLRGARAGSGPAGPCALAWGRTPAAGGPPVISFRGRGWRSPAVQASPFLVAGWLWVALAEGPASAVTVTVAGVAYRCRVMTRGVRS